jgi:predicted esterase
MPTLTERRSFTAGVIALLAGIGCKRKPTTQRTATMGHEPWVLWPSGEPPQGGRPVVLFLHGQGEAAWVVNDDRETEQGRDAVLAHQSPAALHRARDARVKTLWENFVVVAPQAVNDQGLARYWRWSDESVKRRVAAEVEQVLASGKVNAARLCAAGFSRGGLGVIQLDSSAVPLKFRKIVTADAPALDDLQAVAARHHEARIYYARTTFEDILGPHLAAEKAFAASAPQVSFLPTDVSGKDGDAHIAMCSKVFTNDEVYRWLLA